MTTTSGLTEEDYNAAVAAAVDLVRAKHPELDMRAGTAVRALVIEPGALIDASQRDTVNRLRTAMSLKLMAQETNVPREDAEAVLSNFGITLGGGTYADGSVRVNLIGSSDVTVRAGVVFKTEDSTEFVTTDTVTASASPSDGEAEIVSSGDGRYYFTVPVVAKEVGSSGNITMGTALSCSSVITNFYSAEAFSDFSGGEDGESVASAVARIPSALAYRGMTNTLSVRAQLSANMSDPSRLHAVSCVGYRDRSQLRDKHNAFGVSVGGRVDVYARLFEAPGVVSFMADGVLVESYEDAASAETPKNTVGAYLIRIPDEYRGFYAVRSVSEAEQADAMASLQYSLERYAVDGATEAHDFCVGSKSNEEIAWSAYQGGYVTAYDSGDGNDHLSALAVTNRPKVKKFKVDLYWTDGIPALQAVVDGDEVRNVAADYVVRSPAICLVSVNAAVRMKSGVSAVPADLEAAVSAYVNGRSFVGRLTRSEIANVLMQNGAESVDMSAGGMYLGGRVCGADDTWYYLEGDALDVSEVGPDRAMVSTGTVVFAAEPGSVQISVTA